MLVKEIKPDDTWPIRHRVMWPEKTIDFVKVPEDQAGTHYGLYLSEQLASIVSCFESSGEMQFRKFATLTEYQKQGLGTFLLNYILNHAREKGVIRVWCNARLDKIGYYEKFGLRDTKQRFVKEGVGFTIMDVWFG